MKKGLIFVTLLSFSALGSLQAQKIGYVDSEFITSKMPAYQKALTEIDKFAEKWSKDIQDKYSEIDKLQKTYQAEEILLTEDMKRDRLRIISDKEREAREYNNKVFGYEGLLFEKKKDLMKPVTETVIRAIDKVAAQKRLDMVLDKASEGVVLLFTNPKHDYTDYVMEELGLTADQKAKTTATSESVSTNPPEKELNPAGNSKSNTSKPTKQPK
ncbi:OmpH family outer membrane protein [Larkinella humicola]|uniref:OmpH family outer membrane protein n=1 Tax=Larkinella humicola TaxID=2607654 RepID=A0A5N1JGD8_9BACT|nr:OmpH family outer membrane protein [Larkinella humicola]KAA9353557.1 OmpH family outer membrane protein [Larkinella humicola]